MNPLVNSTEQKSNQKKQMLLLKMAALAVFLLICFFIWRKLSSDDLSDVLDDSANKTQIHSKAVAQTSQMDSPAANSGRDIEIRRSRLLDMAVERGKQMPRLWDNKGDSSGVSQNISSLKIDASNPEAPSVNAYTRAQKSLKNAVEKYGSASPLVWQRRLDLALVKEQEHKDSYYDVLELLPQWKQIVQQVKALAKGNPSVAGRVGSTAALLKDRGLTTFCSWIHDSGEILAMIFWGHQDSKNAIEVIRQLEDVDRLTPSSVIESPAAIHKMITLARLCASQNEYGEARKILAFAESECAKIHIGEVVGSEQILASCLLEQSRLSLAEHDFGAAAALARQAAELIGKDSRLEVSQAKAIKADILEQLARSLVNSPGKIAEAVEMQEQCLDLRQQNFGKDGVFSVATALDLARLLRRRLMQDTESGNSADLRSKDAEQSLSLLKQIILFCKKGQPLNNDVLRADRNASLLLPQAYYELGILYSVCGDFSNAKNNIQSAANIDLKSTEPSFIPNKILDLDTLAALELQSNNIEQARKLTLQASRELDGYVADVLPQLSLAEQISFSDNIECHMNALLATCRDDSSLPLVYGEMIKWKGYLIEQFRLRATAIKGNEGQNLANLLKTHQKLSSDLLSKFVESGTASSANEAEQAKKEEVERTINVQLRDKQKKSLSLTVSELQSRLTKSEALCDFYEFSNSPWDVKAKYAAIVTSANALRWINFGPSKNINEQLAAWRSYDGIRAALPEKGDDSVNPWNSLGQQLAVPLQKLIPLGVTHLWVADESELSRVPWSVLLGKFNSADLQVCQVDSPRELIHLKESKSTDAGRGGMLIVGGIDYSKHNPPAPPLKQAMNEVKQIQSTVEKSQLKCVVQSDYVGISKPTRKNVMNELAKCKIAHLVTHGFFNDSDSVAGSGDRSARFANDTRSMDLATATPSPSRNPLIESGLLVSTGNSSDTKGHENGFLTAEDLLDANLEGCRLVTLSACESGRGKEVSSQGVLGLRSSLMGAGAKCVLLSLWPVPDRPTSELMNVFYKNLSAGASPVQALKLAQAAVQAHEQWKAPYYWAAWVIVGDGWQDN